MVVPILVALVSAVATAAIAVAVIQLVVLLFGKLRSWFEARRARIATGDLAFVLKELTDAGEYRVVQGFFNQDAATVTACQPYQAKSLDEETERIFGNDSLVVLT